LPDAISETSKSGFRIAAGSAFNHLPLEILEPGKEGRRRAPNVDER
jgi:hypothetical protein